MTREEFTRQITAMTKTLYRVSYGLLRREADREDAVQETILKAWEKLPTLRQEQYFQSWVIRILINQCYSIGRQLGRIVNLEDAPPEDADPPSGESSLREAVLALPDKYRVVVILHYIEGYGVEEIAHMLGAPIGTIKTRLYRARNILKHKLEEAQDI